MFLINIYGKITEKIKLGRTSVMLTVSYSAGLFGIDGFTVTVECNAENNIPSFEIVGLPDSAVKEAKQRIKAATENSGYPFPDLEMVINLAPADRRKEGSAFDLAMIAAVLQTNGTIPRMTDLGDKCFVGELSFSGEVRHIRGVLSMTLAARADGKKEIYVPYTAAAEAAVVDGITVYSVKNVRDLVEHLAGREPMKPVERNIEALESELLASDLDFADVKGQERAKRAIEVAAAGGHNLLLIGPPGSGKSMLAKRIPSVLPPLTFSEAVETTKIHSVAGILKEDSSLVCRRPFRSPHHTMSAPSLVGGGAVPMPGEVSLAHNGVLFLDELPEFNKLVTESLRQPLEDGKVTVTRTAGRITFPCTMMLVCAMNPCRCGYYGSQTHECTCKRDDIKKYLSKISGPLLDRIDIQVEVPALSFDELSNGQKAERSADIRERVIKARAFAKARFGEDGPASNAQMSPKQTQDYCKLGEAETAIMKAAFVKMGLSGRGYDRILRVARTIADLDASENIKPHHLAEAVQMRALDRKYW